MIRPTVTVITVAYQSAHIIHDAIETASDADEIICIDNASSDDPASALSDLDVEVVRNGANIGYGAACNRGAERALSDLLLFMNPDVVLAKGAVTALRASAACYPEASVFVPLTFQSGGRPRLRQDTSFDPPLVQRRLRNYDAIVGDCCIDFVEGSVFMIRTALFRDLGGFDENIFLYYEDDDLSLRLRMRRKPIILVRDAHATHLVGQSVAQSFRGIVVANGHKKHSEIYVARKYGYPYHPLSDALREVWKALFYAVTLNHFRLAGAIGRLKGILSAG
jgi:GT2 family glycosyltransferase